MPSWTSKTSQPLLITGRKNTWVALFLNIRLSNHEWRYFKLVILCTFSRRNLSYMNFFLTFSSWRAGLWPSLTEDSCPFEPLWSGGWYYRWIYTRSDDLCSAVGSWLRHDFFFCFCKLSKSTVVFTTIVLLTIRQICKTSLSMWSSQSVSEVSFRWEIFSLSTNRRI